MSHAATFKTTVVFIILTVVISCSDHNGRNEDNRICDFKGLESHFAAPGKEYGTIPFFVWNGDIRKEKIDDYMKMFKEAGCGGVIVHARPGLITEYLSDNWFDLFRYTVDKGKEYDLDVWIYDENSYPSGFAGGHVPDEMPESYNQGQGLKMYTCQVLPDTADRFFLVLKKTTGINEVVENPLVMKGDTGIFYLFEKVCYPKSPWYAGFSYVDLLQKGVTGKFIDITFSGYEKAIRDEFGKTVPGTFTDEPSLNPPSGIRWTPDLFKTFYHDWGYDLETNLPSLFEESGNWKKVRHDYYRTLLNLFIQRWSKPMYNYCNKYNLEFTGHYWEHSWPYNYHSPDVTAMYAWHQRPAIDMLFNNFDESSPGAQFGNVRSVKELASVANQMGRQRTLSETYGGSGWELTFTDMKRLGDWEYALGVNTMNQHLAYYTLTGARKYDYPPSFSYHEPWWNDYRQLNLHFARLSLALSSGFQKNDVLIIEPTTTTWLYDSYVKRNDTLILIGSHFQDFITKLEKSQVEYDLGSEDIIARNGSVRKHELVVGMRSYSTVIIPPMTENLESSTFSLLKKFVSSGGRLIALSRPDMIDGERNDTAGDFFNINAEKIVFPRNTADSAFINMLASGDMIFTSITGGNLYHHKRELKDGRLVFLANSSLEQSGTGTLQITGLDALELNTLTGKVADYKETANGSKITLDFNLPPAGSLLLFISDKKQAGYDLPLEKAELSPVPPASEISVRRDKPNVLTLDFCDLSLAGETFRNLHNCDATDKVFRYYGFANGNPWNTSVQFKTETVDRDTFSVNTGFNVVYHFLTEGKPDLSDAMIVVERPSLWNVFINDQKISANKDEWWLDKDFGVFHCGNFIKDGDNTIALEMKPMSVYAEIEPVYLLGNFSLKSASRGWIVTPPPAGYRTGSWKDQGMPFYPDRISYTKEFEVAGENSNYILKMGKWNGTITEVNVNGKAAGVIAYPPYILDISDNIRPGRNIIEVKVIGSNKNLLGPFHTDAKPGMAAPAYWRNVAAYPSGDKYKMIDYGLMDDFYLFEIKSKTQNIAE